MATSRSISSLCFLRGWCLCLPLALPSGCSGGGKTGSATDGSTESDGSTTMNGTGATDGTDSVGTGSTSTATASTGNTSGTSGVGTTGDSCPEGEYAPCIEPDGSINTSMCVSSNALCLVDDSNDPAFGVCAAEPCSSVNECPCPPEGSEAPVACKELLADMGKVCVLDCSSGQACPEDAVCQDGVCWFPRLDGGGTDTSTSG